MGRLRELLDSAILTPDEKQLLANLLWLLEHVDARERNELLDRLRPLAEHAHANRDRLVEEMREITDELEGNSRRMKNPPR